jgi:phage gpG-like protein
MITVDIPQAEIDRIKKMFERVQSSALEKRMITKSSAHLTRALKKNIAGVILHHRTGQLSRSINYSINKYGVKSWVGEVGSGVGIGERMIYADIHETGGVIKPRPENKSGYLTIPIRAGSTGAINLGLWKYKSGAKKGQDKTPISFSSKVISFRRKKSVTIPARRYMSITAEQEVNNVVNIFETEINTAINNATNQKD